MNLAAGIIMIFLSGIMFFKYRPRSGHGKKLCGIVLLAGFLSCAISDGNLLFLAIFRVGMLSLLAASSLLWIRGEYRHRIFLARRLHRCHRCGKMPWKSPNQYPKTEGARRVCA